MEDIKQYSAIIPLSEYEELKSLRADKENLKQELKKELLAECGTHTYNNTEEHNLKGLGIFGGYLCFGAIIIAQMYFHVDWYWLIVPILALTILYVASMEGL